MERVRTLSVDPGVHHAAWSLFTSTLAPQQLGLVKDQNRIAERFYEIALLTKPDLFIIEIPFIYPDSPVDANDIADLALSAGVIEGAVRAARPALWLAARVRPREWKGTLPKHIHHGRLRTRCPLAKAMIENAIPNKSERHHVWDAVGIGLYAIDKLFALERNDTND